VATIGCFFGKGTKEEDTNLLEKAVPKFMEGKQW
jgi:hypothetical protein